MRRDNKTGVLTRINGHLNPAYFRRYYSKHKSRILRYNRAWRRTHKYSGIGNSDYREILVNLLYQRDGWFCPLCHRIIFPEDASVDHIKQRARGGHHDVLNIRLLHKQCNATRPKWNRRMK